MNSLDAHVAEAMDKDNIEQLYTDWYATCNCGSTSFCLRVDNAGDRWKNIVGTECTECGDQIDWINVEAGVQSEVNQELKPTSGL